MIVDMAGRMWSHVVMTEPREAKKRVDPFLEDDELAFTRSEIVAARGDGGA